MRERIRNFVIIAHVDHGKSTLADRFLELTKTIEKRKMKEQYLDQLELERERGITIKMAPVRMHYVYGGEEYILNLIDTPGHSDFSYEVSRALEAVEGAILLVDATQGIQAQTLANFRSAERAGLVIVGAVNKVDLFEHDDKRLDEAIVETAALLGTSKSAIFKISGKTGIGVKELLDEVIKRVPQPRGSKLKPGGRIASRALVFDSFFDNHKGVIASVRMFDGELKTTDALYLVGKQTEARAKEIGHFMPQIKPLTGGSLAEGEIGYISTGVRDTEKIKIGDTILGFKGTMHHEAFSEATLQAHALPGYKEPQPVVFVSFYPEDADDYTSLNQALQKLKLNDSSLSIEPDQNEVLGRGFKVGFLGRLHFEITAERLRREFGVPTTNTFPSVAYRVKSKKEWRVIVKPEDLPQEVDEIWEPYIKIEVLVPHEDLSQIFAIQKKYRMSEIQTETIGERVKLSATMPLAELVSDFDDQLKSATKGLASFSYELGEYQKADVLRVDFLLAGTLVPGLSRFMPRGTYEYEARRTVTRLKELLPRQQFAQPIQAKADGRIIAREDIPAMRKELGNFGKNGGDRTRKMKLWKKQQRGKKRLEERAEAHIPANIFKELLKK